MHFLILIAFEDALEPQFTAQPALTDLQFVVSQPVSIDSLQVGDFVGKVGGVSE